MILKVFCGKCGQKLAVETSNLMAKCTCPRCGNVTPVADYVPLDQTLHAGTFSMPLTADDATPQSMPAMRLSPAVPAFAPPPIPIAPPPIPAAPPPIPIGPPPIPVAPSPLAIAIPPTPHALPPVDDEGPSNAKAAEVARLVEIAGNSSREALAASGAFARKLLELADRLDAAFYGKRAISVVAGAFLVVLAAQVNERGKLAMFAAGLFFLFVATLGLARVGSLRTADGGWSSGLATRRATEAVGDWLESIGDFARLDAPARLLRLGELGVSAGLILLATRAVLRIEEYHASGHSVARHSWLMAGYGLLLAGAACWVNGWRQRKSGEVVRFGGDEADWPRTMNRLDAVLHCSNQQQMDAARSQSPQLLREVLTTLQNWTPAAFADEYGYQHHLQKHLKKAMPSANPQREVPILDTESGRSYSRPDFVVGDKVVLELKRGLATSSGDRAVGQLGKYAIDWGDRGPIVLVLCAQDMARLGSSFVTRINDLRNCQRAVIVVVVRSRA